MRVAKIDGHSLIFSTVNKRERKNEIFDVLKSLSVNFINGRILRAADPVVGSSRH